MNPAAVVRDCEIRSIEEQLSALMKEPVLSQGMRKKVDGLLALLSVKRGVRAEAAQTRKELAEQRSFRAFLTGAPDSIVEAELRAQGDVLAGSQTLSFTQGPAGGYLVPAQFSDALQLGLAAVDPLLDENVCKVVTEADFSLRPLQVPGWDLSSISATKIGENSQHTPDVAPSASQKLLGRHTYRVSLATSLEWEEDQAAFNSAVEAMAFAFGVGFSRGVGADLVNGDGSTGPQGVLTGAANSGYTTAAAGSISADDVQAMYFALNPIYRNSPKAAWLLADATYELVRKAKDASGRPLINVENDRQLLMGKPVFICPSMPSGAGSKGVVFGDLGHYVIHRSQMLIQRRLQAAGYVEYGKALMVGLLRVDAAVTDPTGGSMPPIQYSTLHV